MAALVLVPASFAWPGPHVTSDPRPDTAIAYPPRGLGLLWSDDARPDRHKALTALLGATRAAVLLILDREHTTRGVAGALELAPATASHHLTVLRDAGPATAHRNGRTVHYLRTPLGDRLADGRPAP